MTNRRIAWIDAAKGLGIILIVLGHLASVEAPSAFYVYIYAFHVPLFFFISGLTLKPGGKPFGAMLADKARTLLVPYLCYALLGYAFYLAGYAAARAAGLGIDQFNYGLWRPLWGVFYGTLGEGRLVAFDLPGTTRDAIHVPFERGGRRYELIDTAGLRRKGKVFEAVEKFSVVKTLQAIADANVVLLLIDATQGVGEQDAHIAGYVLESGRAVVVAVNKWDAVDDYQRQMLERSIESRLGFLKFAEVLHISALKRRGIGAVWKAIDAAHASATRKLSTPQLTRLIHDAVQHQAPKRAGSFRPKLRYAHQGGMNPPVVVVHGNSLEHITDSYKRYLEGRIREHFKLVGTPLRVEMKHGSNPFVDQGS